MIGWLAFAALYLFGTGLHAVALYDNEITGRGWPLYYAACVFWPITMVVSCAEMLAAKGGDNE